MNYKVKILKDTPFDEEGSCIDLKEFRNKYSYLFINDTSDSELIQYLKDERKLQIEAHFRNQIGDWFEPIEIDVNDFKIGDWIWHEKLNVAFCVNHYNAADPSWRPNYCSLEAANSYTNIYKRKATKEEIEKADLKSFINGKVLIGRTVSYYHHNVWKELKNVEKVVKSYIHKTNFEGKFNDINVTYDGRGEFEWGVKFNGLKVGCREISHEDVIAIAKWLKIIP